MFNSNMETIFQEALLDQIIFQKPFGEGFKKNYLFSSLLLLRGPATIPSPPLVVPWVIYILGLNFDVAAMPLISLN